MTKREHITGFYLETLLLIVVFVAIILVLTQVFGLSRAQSAEAKMLTNAVCLAQNAAEAVSAAESSEELLSLLDEGGNARAGEKESVLVTYDDDMRPAAEGPVTVEVTWETADGDARMVYSTVSVWRSGAPEPVYTLHTASYLEGVSP